MLKLYVPDTIAPPAAHYVHGIEVPPDARWLYTAGQVGISKDGETPKGFVAQSHQVWKNTIEVLKAANMGVEDIVKLVVYATNAEDVKHLSEIRKEYMGDHIPTSTFIGGIKLANPAWVVEMETIAAKVD